LQDPGTRLAVGLLAPQLGETVLDVCAAPGGKSLLIADTMKTGKVIAMDLPGTRIDRLKENLARAFKDGHDLEARAHMMSAAAMGATAFQKGLGAIHALSHPVGALHDTHHGMTNAVFMPYVLVFNRPAIEAKIERLAAFIGLEPNFDAFLGWVLDLRQQLGVPHTLKEFGVELTNLDLMSKMAPEDPTAGGNPVPLTEADARMLFEKAYSGQL
jgi:alcohol dehydrogenase